MDESQEQKNNRPWLYKKGQSGNPGGRPKGSKSLKTYIRERFERMTDEEREDFLEGLDKKDIWHMGEGKPEAVLTDPAGNALQQVLVKIIRDGDKADSN